MPVLVTARPTQKSGNTMALAGFKSVVIVQMEAGTLTTRQFIASLMMDRHYMQDLEVAMVTARYGSLTGLTGQKSVEITSIVVG